MADATLEEKLRALESLEDLDLVAALQRAERIHMQNPTGLPHFIASVRTYLDDADRSLQRARLHINDAQSRQDLLGPLNGAVLANTIDQAHHTYVQTQQVPDIAGMIRHLGTEFANFNTQLNDARDALRDGGNGMANGNQGFLSRHKGKFALGTLLAGAALAADALALDWRYTHRIGDWIAGKFNTTAAQVAKDLPESQPYHFQYQLHSSDNIDDQSTWVHQDSLPLGATPTRARIVFRTSELADTTITGPIQVYNLQRPEMAERLALLLRESEQSDAANGTLAGRGEHNYMNRADAAHEIVRTLARGTGPSPSATDQAMLSETELEHGFSEGWHRGFFGATEYFTFNDGTKVRVTGRNSRAVREARASLEENLEEQFTLDKNFGRVSGTSYSDEQLRQIILHAAGTDRALSVTEANLLGNRLDSDQHLGRAGGYTNPIAVGEHGGRAYTANVTSTTWNLADDGGDIGTVLDENASNPADRVARSFLEKLNARTGTDTLLQARTEGATLSANEVRAVYSALAGTDGLSQAEVNRLDTVSFADLGIEGTVRLGTDSGTAYVAHVSKQGSNVVTQVRASGSDDGIVVPDIASARRLFTRFEELASSNAYLRGHFSDALQAVDANSSSAGINAADVTWMQNQEASFLVPQTWTHTIGTETYTIEHRNGAYKLKDSQGDLCELTAHGGKTALEAGQSLVRLLSEALPRDTRRGIASGAYTRTQLGAFASSNQGHDGDSAAAGNLPRVSYTDVQTARAAWERNDHLSIPYRVQVPTRANDGRQIPFFVNTTFAGATPTYNLEWRDGTQVAEMENPEAADITIRAYNLTLEDRNARATSSDLSRFVTTVVDRNNDGTVQQAEAQLAYDALQERRRRSF